MPRNNSRERKAQRQQRAEERRLNPTPVPHIDRAYEDHDWARAIGFLAIVCNRCELVWHPDETRPSGPCEGYM